MAYARQFMVENLPFWEMEPQDGMVSGASNYTGKNNLVTAQVFVKEDEIYAVYLPVAENTGTLDLRASTGKYLLRWYNPRTGMFVGTETLIQAGSSITLGQPPHTLSEDWVVLLKKKDEG